MNCVSPIVSVVIPTVNRLKALRRAVNSVARQDFGGKIEVVVVALERSARQIAAVQNVLEGCGLPYQLQIFRTTPAVCAANPLFALYAPARTAHQRNLGVKVARGEYVAHLDDDNEYEVDHLSSLVRLLERRPEISAAHSWRKVLWNDETPFTSPLYPWVKQRNLNHSRFAYDDLVRHKVFQRGSCEVRDALRSPSGNQLLTVDSSEWMLRRAFNRRVRFRERLTFREVSHALGDDYLFCQQLVKLDISVLCSRRCTLKYYLGGRSNSWMKREAVGGFR